MNGVGYRRVLVVAALLLAVPAIAVGGTPQVDIGKLSTEFDHWHSVNSGDGFLYLDNTTWGSFFIFWAPTPEGLPKTIDQAYVLETVSALRGEPTAPFTVQGGDKAKVHGHKGYTVSGTVEGSGVTKHYTVFNCKKSKRLFLSEIDLHTSCGTPEAVAERLAEVERTISCHGVDRRINNPKVPLKMNFPALNLQFYIPENWRSDIYQEGSTADQGGVWTLPINSDHKIFYRIAGASDAAVAASATLEGFANELRTGVTDRTVELMPEGDGVPLEREGGYLLKGAVLVKDETFNWDTGKHVFRLRLWQDGGNWHCLLYSVLSRDEFEGRKVYLQPDDSIFLALEERIAKAVDGFPEP